MAAGESVVSAVASSSASSSMTRSLQKLKCAILKVKHKRTRDKFASNSLEGYFDF